MSVLGLGNYMGEAYLWYDTVPFYDVYMHLLGGFAVCLFSLALIGPLWPDRARTRKGFHMALAMVIASGLAWEIYEALAGTSGNPFGTLGYVLDTSKDFLNDLIGGVVGVYCARFFRDPVELTVSAKAAKK